MDNLGVLDKSAKEFFDDVNFISSLYEVYQDMTTFVEAPGHHIEIQTTYKGNYRKLSYNIDEHGNATLIDAYDMRIAQAIDYFGHVTIRQAFLDKVLRERKSLFGGNAEYRQYDYLVTWEEETFETH